MKSPVIAIDIDEVLFPFVPELLRYHNQRQGTKHSVTEVLNFEFGFWGVADAEAIERVHEFARQDHRAIAPLVRAREALRDLRQHYQVVIVTSRDPEFEAGTLAWLKHHIPGLYEGVILTGNKYNGRPYRSKIEVCHELGAVVLVDDQLHYAEEASRHGLPFVLFGDYPWNQAPALPEGVWRARDWSEVVSLIGAKLVA